MTIEAMTARLLASGDASLGAGFVAFVIVLALCVASFFLFRSMSRHLRKVPDSFDPPPKDEGSK